MNQRTIDWRGRRVFLTGHTGFKGGWLALRLAQLGATVRGYALAPSTAPSLFEAARVGSVMEDPRGDIRDTAALNRALGDFAPEVVFHLAAQPLVRASYVDPIGTFETNIMGTARVLDQVRRTPSVRAVVCVTSDKCYKNKEWPWGYRETDPLGGHDPYSSSKACAELVAASYRQSYFPTDRFSIHGVAVATVRAGNVIGGGDWSQDRLVPDLLRGFLRGQPARIRNPRAVRPWQYVLEPVDGYIRLAEQMLGPDGSRYATAFNFGPGDADARPVSWLADQMSQRWGEGAGWIAEEEPQGVHEAGVLRLDVTRAQAELAWKPLLGLPRAVEWVVAWQRAQVQGEDMQRFSLAQTKAYEALRATEVGATS